MVGRHNADNANTLHLRDVATANIFLVFYICGAYWRLLANTTEPSICSGNEALCHITLTTCYLLLLDHIVHTSYVDVVYCY